MPPSTSRQVQSPIFHLRTNLHLNPNQRRQSMNPPLKFELSIIGLGYVGLPLSLQFAKSGCRVLGLDIDPAKIKEIEAGRSYIRHIPAEDVAAQVKAGRFSASSDFSLVR